jgi:uncharacterized FlaG/YvyC family protein
MPLEGVNPAGRLIPETQKTEAAKLGAFDSRVEENERIKPLKDEDKEKKDQQEREEQEYPEYELSEELQEKTQSHSPAVLPEKIDKSISYTIRFNKYTELVELVDIDTGRIIQTIPPQDLIELITELKYTSGLFFDSEI